jgi:hypothetical protein
VSTFTLFLLVSMSLGSIVAVLLQRWRRIWPLASIIRVGIIGALLGPLAGAFLFLAVGFFGVVLLAAEAILTNERVHRAAAWSAAAATRN